jgi:hypothetical protein
VTLPPPPNQTSSNQFRTRFRSDTSLIQGDPDPIQGGQYPIQGNLLTGHLYRGT